MQDFFLADNAGDAPHAKFAEEFVPLIDLFASSIETHGKTVEKTLKMMAREMKLSVQDPGMTT